MEADALVGVSLITSHPPYQGHVSLPGTLKPLPRAAHQDLQGEKEVLLFLIRKTLRDIPAQRKEGKIIFCY